jgi:hypothetical protein
MLKGRLTALASVIALVALTGGAAGLSWATSPISSGSNPLAAATASSESSAKTIAAFRSLLKATLTSRSFSELQGETLLKFQPPDRAQAFLADGHGHVVIVSGNSAFLLLHENPTEWGEEPSNTIFPTVNPLRLTKGFLDHLQTMQDVQEKTGVFTVTARVPKASLVEHLDGTETEIFTVFQSEGRISRVVVQLHGDLPGASLGVHALLHPVTSTFFGYGHSSVPIPSADVVAKVDPCNQNVLNLGLNDSSKCT